MKKKTFNKLKIVFCSLLALLLGTPLAAQVNSGAKYNKNNHNKQIIGYLTQWDAWKEQSGIVPKGGYNQLNIDYSQYTILNWSFVGVAEDGSLHSGDLRAKDIWRPEVSQKPGPMFWDDIYSSWDYWLLYGELQVIHYLADDLDKQPSNPLYWVYEQYGYKGTSTGWVNTRTGETGSYPVSVPKKGSQYKGLLDLAHANGTKVMLSIGGWSMCKHFPAVAADPVKRARFMRDCKKAIDMGFDGIDIDWEYPGKEGMNFQPTPGDYKNFTTLMQEIRNTIGPDKLITAAFYAGPGPLRDLEWTKLNKIMDYYNFMTYDWGGAWNNTPNHNSPLYDYPQSEWGAASWNTLYEALKTFGTDMSMVVFGMAPYGRGVICQTDAALDVNVKTAKRQVMVEPDGPVVSALDDVNWKLTGGSPNYNEIVKVLASGGWTKHWDDNAKVPYATKGKYFLSYDDERSIGLKAQYINDKQLAGTIIWHVWADMMNMTDQVQTVGNKFAYCPKTKPVLMQKINEVFATGNGGGGITPPPTNTPPTVSITNPSNGTTVTTSIVNVTATANDSDGSIAKVEFYLNGVLKSTETFMNRSLRSGSYTTSISGLISGSNSIMAKAYDDKGATASSSVSVTYSVSTSNQLPIVSITSPSNGSSVSTSNVTVNATATDPDGTISKVEFFLNGMLKSTDTSAPYSASISGLSSGSNTLMARATDNKGATAESSVLVTYSTGTVTPPPGNSNIESLLPRTLYEQMFPYRNGYNTTTGVREGDFYSYDKLIEAVRFMSNIKAKHERRCASNAYRITRIDKTTGAETVIREDQDFKNSNAAIITEYVDYGDFVNYGSNDVRKRELMAFLANTAQETTGGWATAPGGRYAWGLHFKEEVGYNDNSMAYRDENHPIYPPAPGKSYHGRGPIQLTHNYNYGAMSEFLYGTKSTLLNNPEKVTQDGAIAFMTGIWFWMTPQYPKVSCHDAMTGKWIPTPTQTALGLKPGFGATVNIINGGIECNQGTEFEKVVHRIGHFDKFCKLVNVSMAVDGSNSTTELGCATMKPFQIDYTECNGLPGGGGEGGGGGETGGGENCGTAAWSSTKEYMGGDKAYYDGYVYTASYWSKNARPDLNFGPYGQPWKAREVCTGGGGGGTTNEPPVVSIITPSNNTTATTSTITATANALDPDGSVSKVEFYLNGTLKHTAVSAPYSTTLGTLISGSNQILVRAYDNKGAIADASVNVTYSVSVSNQPPVVSITSPSNGSTVNMSTVMVNAAASDSDGSISKVEFYLNGILKHTAVSAPYSTTLGTLNSGSNQILARAYDNKGATADASVSVSYSTGGGGGTGDCMGVEPWSPTKIYTGGEQVHENGVIYKANHWTQNNQPSTNNGVGKPWAVVSKCDGTLDEDAFGETVVCGGAKVLVWKKGDTYDKARTKVYYEGKIYSAKYWTKGNTPGASDAWKYEGTCD